MSDYSDASGERPLVVLAGRRTGLIIALLVEFSENSPRRPGFPGNKCPVRRTSWAWRDMYC
jgi:hypothetical protein